MTDISLMCWGDLCDGRPLDKCAFKVKVVYKLPRAERSLALQPFFPFVKDRHVLVRTDNVAVVLYINHQADSPYCLLQRLVERFLLRADWNPISIREVHVPSRLNCSVDILSRGDTVHGEWRLHPQTGQMIWSLFGEVEVDLFALEENAHCPLFFSLMDTTGLFG